MHHGSSLIVICLLISIHGVRAVLNASVGHRTMSYPVQFCTSYSFHGVHVCGYYMDFWVWELVSCSQTQHGSFHRTQSGFLISLRSSAFYAPLTLNQYVVCRLFTLQMSCVFHGVLILNKSNNKFDNILNVNMKITFNDNKYSERVTRKQLLFLSSTCPVHSQR